MRQKQRLQRSFPVKLAVFIVAYAMLTLLMYWIVADDWQMTAVKTDAATMSKLLPTNSRVTQVVSVPMDGLEKVTIVPHLETHEGNGSISVQIEADGNILKQMEIPASSLISDVEYDVNVEPYLEELRGKEIAISFIPNDTGMALWAGTTMAAGKFEVGVMSTGLSVDGEPIEGQLVMTMQGHNRMYGTAWFWIVVLGIGAACVTLASLTYRQLRHGKRTILTVSVDVFHRFGYLLKQLVWRDFRVKYKSSMLGMLWSFLNPLLTMLVYLFVFSTLFISNIAYFPAYLMSGIVLFNFFSESTSLGLNAIVGNSALITKVYMPKMIYPLSKVLSSAINLCISFIPLLIVMVVTGVPIQRSLLLLPWVVLFLLLLSFGVSLILSTLNVFFRDMQFLWSVLLTMLNFLTPIFYPESIIPVRFQTLYHLNPLYQITYFMRSITINGVSPAPITYLYCLLASLIPLALGLWIFRKNQDKFVLHL